jgi:hypothetical protein
MNILNLLSLDQLKNVIITYIYDDPEQTNSRIRLIKNLILTNQRYKTPTRIKRKLEQKKRTRNRRLDQEMKKYEEIYDNNNYDSSMKYKCWTCGNWIEYSRCCDYCD